MFFSCYGRKAVPDFVNFTLFCVSAIVQNIECNFCRNFHLQIFTRYCILSKERFETFQNYLWFRYIRSNP